MNVTLNRFQLSEINDLSDNHEGYNLTIEQAGPDTIEVSFWMLPVGSGPVSAYRIDAYGAIDELTV